MTEPPLDLISTGSQIASYVGLACGWAAVILTVLYAVNIIVTAFRTVADRKWAAQNDADSWYR